MNEYNINLISEWDDELDDLFTNIRESFSHPYVQESKCTSIHNVELDPENGIAKTEPTQTFNGSKVHHDDDLYTENDIDDAKARRRKHRMWQWSEDLRLERALTLYGKRTWRRIAEFVGTRTAQQCRERCQRKYGMNEHRTHARCRWTKEEDAQLRMLVERYNGQWTKIARMMVNRNRFQCRDRYVNILARKVRHATWTVEEDDKLLHCVAQHGVGSWARIGKLLGTGRPAYLVHQRYLKLCGGDCEDDYQ